MKILIVGVKGFIGSHCLNFFGQDHEVWGCDVYTDYNERNFFLIDTLGASYHPLFQDQQYDVCINCAGAASVPDSMKHPERDYELNVLLVYKLLDSIRQFNPDCRFINISSAAVYGSPMDLPIHETHDLNPVSPYGLHKVYAEQICREFATHFFIRTCSLRIFSAFGPGLKKQLFWDIFLKSRSGSSIELFGTGDESRDFIYVTDIVLAMNRVMQKGAFMGESYNLGYGKQYPIREVARQFVNSLGWSGELKFSGHERKGDPLRWEADIRKLRALGFEPGVTIEEGIRKYAEWVSRQS